MIVIGKQSDSTKKDKKLLTISKAIVLRYQL